MAVVATQAVLRAVLMVVAVEVAPLVAAAACEEVQ